MKETFLTKEGLADIQAELSELKTVRRREIADAIHTAKEQGDLSENAEYASAKEEQNRIEQHIAELEATLKNATIIKKAVGGVVAVGSMVTIDCDGKVKQYHIVGSNEANPLDGKISNESPIGQALLGKKEKDTASIPAPGGDRECTVTKVE